MSNRERDQAERAARYEQGAQQALGAGDVQAVFTVKPPTADRLAAGKASRPYAMAQAETSGDRFFHRVGRIASILDFDSGKRRDAVLPTGTAERDRLCERSSSTDPRDRDACWHFGDWSSMAGRLLLATQPWYRHSLTVLLAVRSTDLDLVYVSSGPRPEQVATHAEHAWTQPRTSLAWTRDLTDRRRHQPGFQLGFTDGSWTTLVAASIHGGFQLGDLFPKTLPSSTPIPRSR